MKLTLKVEMSIALILILLCLSLVVVLFRTLVLDDIVLERPVKQRGRAKADTDIGFNLPQPSNAPRIKKRNHINTADLD